MKIYKLFTSCKCYKYISKSFTITPNFTNFYIEMKLMKTHSFMNITLLSVKEFFDARKDIYKKIFLRD